VSSFTRLAVLGALLSLAGCKAKPTPTPPNQAAGSAPTAAASVSAQAPLGVTAPAAVGLADTDVRAFIERWQAAQNSHDFEAYARLYADRFMGLKRVGPYSKRFDRAGWLADRKPMFDAGARIEISGIELVASTGATRAIFTQRFSSGSFRDVGKKELFLAATPGGISITKEEMLDSTVSDPPSTASNVLAYQRDGVVVQRGFDKQKLKGPPRLVEAGATDPVELAYAVAPESLSEATRAWRGRELTAFAADGSSCTGKVARFEVRVQAVPHFGMREAWRGEAPAQIASAVENMAQDHEHFVVGVLDRACKGSWGIPAPAGAFTPARPAEGALREAGISAFKALPAYAELQRRFVTESKLTDRGWEADGKLLRVMELRVPARPALLLVTARTDGGCAEFSGSLSALWQLEGSESALKLRPLGPTLGQYVTLRGAVDQGEAGLALLAGPDDFDDELTVLRVSPRVTRHVLLSTAVWDCLC